MLLKITKFYVLFFNNKVSKIPKNIQTKIKEEIKKSTMLLKLLVQILYNKYLCMRNSFLSIIVSP